MALSAEDREEIKRHMNVLMEHSDKNFGTIVEQYQSIIGKLDKNESDINEIKSEVETIKMALFDAGRKVEKHEEKLSHL